MVIQDKMAKGELIVPEESKGAMIKPVESIIEG